MEFKEVKENPTELTKTWGIETDFHSARVGRKKYFDELSSDKRLTNLKTRFKCNIVYTNLDFIITHQINH